jgi:hypothetical protein
MIGGTEDQRMRCLVSSMVDRTGRLIADWGLAEFMNKQTGGLKVSQFMATDLLHSSS